MSKALDLIVGGVPRGGTTVAAKLLSLHPETFCYAGETHLIPFMHSMFGSLPCRRERVDSVAAFLRQQFMTAMVEMPRFSVKNGAHPANLIFDEESVDDLIDAVSGHLYGGLYGAALYETALNTLAGILSKVDRRRFLGEKTPSNIFAMADYASDSEVRKVSVMREPVGVLKSMKARVEGGDSYADAFRGNIEANIGMYMEYAMSAAGISSSSESLLVRYEDLALCPERVIRAMFALFGGEPDERIIRFVERGGDPEVANRAPMNYRRLNVSTEYAGLTPLDVWKIFSFTHQLRDLFGYSDEKMAEYGYKVPSEYPGVAVPLTVLPLYGFHNGGWGGAWMKRRGAVVAYLPKVGSHDISLTFKSRFPEEIEAPVKLKVSVNGETREVLEVGSGSQSTGVVIKVAANELEPMGNDSGYVVINFESTVSFCRLGHSVNGNDAGEISFTLKDRQIKKNKRRAGWLVFNR